MKKIIDKKLDQHTKMLDKSLEDFIKSNKRVDRDSVIRIQTRINTYKEILDLIEKEEKK